MVKGPDAGSLQISGIANAPTAAEAINFSTQSAAPVPEPGTWAAAVLSLLVTPVLYAIFYGIREEA
jgi:hypothetical protein